jgi:hypothetical protein
MAGVEDFLGCKTWGIKLGSGIDGLACGTEPGTDWT